MPTSMREALCACADEGVSALRQKAMRSRATILVQTVLLKTVLLKTIVVKTDFRMGFCPVFVLFKVSVWFRKTCAKSSVRKTGCAELQSFILTPPPA